MTLRVNLAEKPNTFEKITTDESVTSKKKSGIHLNGPERQKGKKKKKKTTEEDE